MVTATSALLLLVGVAWEAGRSGEGPWVCSRAYSTERKPSPRAAVPVSVHWGRKRGADPPGSGHGPPAKVAEPGCPSACAGRGTGRGGGRETPSGEPWRQAGRGREQGPRAGWGVEPGHRVCTSWDPQHRPCKVRGRTARQPQGIPDARSFASHGLGDLVSKNHVGTRVEKGGSRAK